MATSPKQPPSITDITEDEDAVDPHLVQVDDYDPGAGDEPPDDISFADLEHGEALTTTDNLNRRHHVLHTETVDQIIDLGVEILDPNADSHVVRVHTDVGPVYYGDTNRPLELKRNRRYRVPSSIHRYLHERGLLVDQLVEYQA
jgi:hypothetical protein